MRVLVSGGAGYIGSIVTECLVARGDQVTVYDSLITGHRAAVPSEVTFIHGDIRDRARLTEAFVSQKIEAVVHLAALSLVGDSVKEPALYYENNVVGTLSLLGCMQEVGVKKLVFSSTAAVYGEPDAVPILESARTQPTSPYGATKLAIEQALAWYDRAYGLRFAALRYFNAAGASVLRGEDHRPETHLIPKVLQAALSDTPLTIYGNDYPSQDGTAIRDYIHVLDLADAHLKALDALDAGSQIYNLGCGGGFSVLDVVEMARRITQKPLPVSFGPRRAGDPALLIASSQHIHQTLGWVPRHNLEDIISSVWLWMQRFPNGYSEGV